MRPVRRLGPARAGLATLAAVALTVGGCAGSPPGNTPVGSREPEATVSSSTTASPSPQPAPGCWLPDSGKPSCGWLTSTRGTSPDGTAQDLAGEVALSSSVFSPRRDYLELVTRFKPCGTITTPVRVAAVWTPEVGGRVVSGDGCANGPVPAATRWVREVFDRPFSVAVLDPATVRVTAASGAVIELTWT